MKRTIMAGICAGALLAFSVGLVEVSSAPAAGKTLSVRSLRARIMSSPAFLGSSVATVRRGARVKMIRAKGSWYNVSYRGRSGWIHKNRVTVKLIKLSSGGTGSGTTSGEAELAGRGFSPKTEAKFKAKNPNYNFAPLDKIQQADVDPVSVQQFLRSGQIAPPTKRGGK